MGSTFQQFVVEYWPKEDRPERSVRAPKEDVPKAASEGSEVNAALPHHRQWKQRHSLLNAGGTLRRYYPLDDRNKLHAKEDHTKRLRLRRTHPHKGPTKKKEDVLASWTKKAVQKRRAWGGRTLGLSIKRTCPRPKEDRPKEAAPG